MPANASSTKPARRGENTASPSRHAADGVGQLGPGDGLGDVAARAGADDRDDVLRRVRHDEGEEAHARAGAARRARMTSAPPPPGIWTSSRTTSGSRGARCTRSRRRRSRASPTTSTRPSSSARTPARKSAWSSTRTTRGSAHRALQHELDLGARPRRGVHLGAARRGAPCARAIDSRRPRRSAGTAGGVEARPAVAHEHLDAVARHLGVDTTPARRRRTSRR